MSTHLFEVWAAELYYGHSWKLSKMTHLQLAVFHFIQVWHDNQQIRTGFDRKETSSWYVYTCKCGVRRDYDICSWSVIWQKKKTLNHSCNLHDVAHNNNNNDNNNNNNNNNNHNNNNNIFYNNYNFIQLWKKNMYITGRNIWTKSLCQ